MAAIPPTSRITARFTLFCRTNPRQTNGLMNRNSKATGNLGRISAETALKLAGSPDELRAMPTSKVFESLLALL